jgi:hypothetical protein
VASSDPAGTLSKPCAEIREDPLEKQKNYQQTFELACAKIKEMDPGEMAVKAGGDLQKGSEGERIVIECFSEPYHIRFPEIEFHASAKRTVSLVARILILHYLMKADGAPHTGEWVPYKDVPGGLLYASVFARRVTEPLIQEFGNSSSRFREAGLKMGGTPVEIGDASFTINAFPKVPLQYVLWQGDEEFPPGLQLLFDSSIDHYLSLEDMVVLGQMASGRLIQKSVEEGL